MQLAFLKLFFFYHWQKLQVSERGNRVCPPFHRPSPHIYTAFIYRHPKCILQEFSPPPTPKQSNDPTSCRGFQAQQGTGSSTPKNATCGLMHEGTWTGPESPAQREQVTQRPRAI